MKKRPFYFEIQNLVAQFMSAFNDIAIKRYDKDRVADENSIGVGFMYSPKQRVINDLLTASRTIPLPAISISIAGITRDPERVFNKLNGHLINTAKAEDAARQIPQPVPINITINMSIVARYQADIEQIISNFVPYCDPYITVSWKLPTTENTTYEREIRTIIEWNGSLNMQYPVELASNQLARVTCDTSFTIKGWLFKEINTSYSKIYEINTNFIPALMSGDCYVFNNTSDTDPVSYTSTDTERFVFAARPFLRNIDYPLYHIGSTDTNYTYTVYGDNFVEVTDVYLQTDSSNLFSKSKLQIPFSDSKFNKKYPPFSGIRINTYKVNNRNFLTFSVPENLTIPGKFDVIIKNQAGYGVLSKDSLLPAHSTNVTDIVFLPKPYQPACTNGIIVL